MILRYEAWGAWARLESMPAIVALDRDGVRALGLDGGAVWHEADQAPKAPDPRASRAPVELHVAATEKCGVGCEGCYLDARPDGRAPAFEELVRRLDAAARAGVFTIAFGGGEPLTRDDLPALAEAARARGLVPVLTTSGFGMTRARAEALTGFAQINVSYDGAGDAYEAVRGVDGARGAERAIEALSLAGIRVGVNVVLTRATFDALPSTLTRARALGAREAQLLRYKPAGRAAKLDYYARRLAPEQARALGRTLRALARDLPDFGIRIDCALVPFLSADDALYAAPEKLAAWGVLGCEAAQALTAVRVDGTLAPCSFAPASSVPVDRLAKGFAEDPELAAWRTSPGAEPCLSCNLRPLCKGGCKVVARFTAPDTPVAAPDPECPRVLARRGASA
jgi:radical SAM protein with 4Fe4S-binding SPASM domain